jgi:hypothetical protein
LKKARKKAHNTLANVQRTMSNNLKDTDIKWLDYQKDTTL